MAPWCSGYHYFTTSFNKAWTQVLRRFKFCSWRVGDSRWWESLTVVLAGNKAKRLSTIIHTTKTIHHHQAGIFRPPLRNRVSGQNHTLQLTLAAGYYSSDLQKYTPMLLWMRTPKYTPMLLWIRAPKNTPMLLWIRAPKYTPMLLWIRTPKYTPMLLWIRAPKYTPMLLWIRAPKYTPMLLWIRTPKIRQKCNV